MGDIGKCDYLWHKNNKIKGVKSIGALQMKVLNASFTLFLGLRVCVWEGGSLFMDFGLIFCFIMFWVKKSVLGGMIE